MLSRAEVERHTSRTDCWTIIHDIVYNLSSFLNEHPGGPAVLLKYAGGDASEAFDQVHKIDVIQKSLKPEDKLGAVAMSDSDSKVNEAPVLPTGEVRITVPSSRKRFRLDAVINLHDFERAAAVNMSAEGFAFYKTGADDEHTVQWNTKSWSIVRFRPRILRPIRTANLSTTIMGTAFDIPFFICPAGGGGLAHRTGEVLMTKAAAKQGALHWVCNMASRTKIDMAQARRLGQTLYWQIYAMDDLAKTEKEIVEAIQAGYKGFALTVDAIRAGKRERDMRIGVEEKTTSIDEQDDTDESLAGGGLSAKRAALWSSFDWPGAISWIRKLTTLPVAIKGIQSWEDAELCMQYGVHPWLSNHGGRQLEGAPSAIETLLEIRQHCPQVLEKCDVIVDGGIRRGTDVVKALALGARAVGLGRPFLYALSFGEAGVSKAINILVQEMETAMALLGVEDIKDLGPEHVDASAFPMAGLLRARL